MGNDSVNHESKDLAARIAAFVEQHSDGGFVALADAVSAAINDANEMAAFQVAHNPERLLNGEPFQCVVQVAGGQLKAVYTFEAGSPKCGG